MTNSATINDLSDTRIAFLRESLAILVRHHGPDDIVQILSEVLDDYAMTYARRTGDYDGAASMKIIAAYLSKLERALDNYDPTEE
jgi:hypothetical protein